MHATVLGGREDILQPADHGPYGPPARARYCTGREDILQQTMGLMGLRDNSSIQLDQHIEVLSTGVAAYG